MEEINLSTGLREGVYGGDKPIHGLEGRGLWKR